MFFYQSSNILRNSAAIVDLETLEFLKGDGWHSFSILVSGSKPLREWCVNRAVLSGILYLENLKHFRDTLFGKSLEYSIWRILSTQLPIQTAKAECPGVAGHLVNID